VAALVSGSAVAQYQKPAEGRRPPPASLLDNWNYAGATQQPGKKPDDSSDLAAKQKKDDENNRAKYVKTPPNNLVFGFPDDAAMERMILDRLRQDEVEAGRDPMSKYGPNVRFPAGPIVGGGAAYQAKTTTYPPMRAHHEAMYVVHRRLHFEEKNAERYGWDLGIIQTFVSAAYFYKDVLLWPNSLASGVVSGFWDTNAGKCLPGSPTPYMLYPPGLTITGGVVEGVFVTGLAFAIP
jgi:hypothetical protein